MVDQVPALASMSYPDRCGPEPACGRAPTASQEGSLKVRFALYKIAETVRLNAIGEDSKQQKPRQMARGCLDS